MASLAIIHERRSIGLIAPGRRQNSTVPSSSDQPLQLYCVLVVRRLHLQRAITNLRFHVHSTVTHNYICVTNTYEYASHVQAGTSFRGPGFLSGNSRFQLHYEWTLKSAVQWFITNVYIIVFGMSKLEISYISAYMNHQLKADLIF